MTPEFFLGALALGLTLISAIGSAFGVKYGLNGAKADIKDIKAIQKEKIEDHEKVMNAIKEGINSLDKRLIIIELKVDQTVRKDGKM